jgi:hypothetical protein
VSSNVTYLDQAYAPAPGIRSPFRRRIAHTIPYLVRAAGSRFSGSRSTSTR